MRRAKRTARFCRGTSRVNPMLPPQRRQWPILAPPPRMHPRIRCLWPVQKPWTNGKTRQPGFSNARVLTRSPYPMGALPIGQRISTGIARMRRIENRASNPPHEPYFSTSSRTTGFQSTEEHQEMFERYSPASICETSRNLLCHCPQVPGQGCVIGFFAGFLRIAISQVLALKWQCVGMNCRKNLCCSSLSYALQ